MAVKKKEEKSNRGRKWFDLTEEDIEKGRTEEFIVSKIREVWSIGGTNVDASSYTDVSEKSISRYVKAHKGMDELRERLRNKPTLKARQEVVKGLNNYHNAMDYLKRKKKLEFGDNVDLTSGGQKIESNKIIYQDFKDEAKSK